MRIKALIITTGLLLSGCSATLTSRDIALDLRAPKSVPIGVKLDLIDTSKTSNTGAYFNSRNDLYSTLLSESRVRSAITRTSRCCCPSPIGSDRNSTQTR